MVCYDKNKIQGFTVLTIDILFFWVVTQCSQDSSTKLSAEFLANNQLYALFHVFIYIISLCVSSITVLIIRRSNCI